MDNIITYFLGEKFQCTVGAMISITFITISIYFLFQQKQFLKGIAYATIPLSILLFIICITVIYKNSTDIERVTTFYKDAPQKIHEVEIPRIQNVMKIFGILKKVEIVIFLLGFVIVIAFWKNEMLRGVGVGLMIMGACLYTFDHLAESRSELYMQFLKSF
ncbi:hypothetical protein [Leptospira sp. GIMC2001]|uniref:hypothetical protein n=1 Tax=Leptospira sp. GIMC2001 TaxID=1513297 RepID=UPI002349CBE8|nr:hypothetical protein [Leptospira sp. GIMC2001]WCL49918.1 hypothetical protein O4O04_03620 [Leptospira sp. GIMC2001]